MQGMSRSRSNFCGNLQHRRRLNFYIPLLLELLVPRHCTLLNLPSLIFVMSILKICCKMTNLILFQSSRIPNMSCHFRAILARVPAYEHGSMIISLLMNITMNQLGGASVIAIFTTPRSHGYVNTTTWLGISQFFLFLAPNFNILTTENRSRCNRDLN